MPAKGASTPTAAPDVAVVGGGVIGLSVAWTAARRGLRVTLLDRGALGDGASRVAAGMLAPVSEAHADEPDLLRAGIESAARWGAFAAELEEASGLACGYRRCGTLAVARDADEAAALERESRQRERLGLSFAPLRPSEARALEPALAPGLRAALEFPDDHAVDPRAVCAALALACERAGVTLRPHEQVAAWDARGATLADGRRVLAGRVVLAAGAWSGPPVRPVKGQLLRLRDPAGPGLLERVVRFGGGSSGPAGYIVPRGDGRYVLGATTEERGFDTTVTAGALRELLHEAQLLVPGLDELVVEEALAGLRPGTPDNAPLLGADAAGVVWAAGHHRNGILLAPLTADAVAALLAAQAPLPQTLAPFAPERFAEVPAR